MKKKLRAPGLKNKNGPVKITQRGYGPITFQGYISWPGIQGSVEVKITTSVRGWHELRFRTMLTPELFGKAFDADIIEPIYHHKLQPKPKERPEHLDSKRIKILSALFYLYFLHSNKSKAAALAASLKRISALYPDKGKLGVKSFKITYIYDGNDILSRNTPPDEVPVLLDTLEFLYIQRIKEMFSLKKKEAHTILAYNLISAAEVHFMKIFSNEIFYPELLDKRFVEMGLALRRNFPLENKSNHTPA